MTSGVGNNVRSHVNAHQQIKNLEYKNRFLDMAFRRVENMFREEKMVELCKMLGGVESNKRVRKMFERMKEKVKRVMEESYRSVMERELKCEGDVEMVQKNYESKMEMEKFMREMER